MGMIRDFLTKEDGAVTVDYVVMLGGVVSLGLAVVGSVGSATVSFADSLSEAIVATEFTHGTPGTGTETGGGSGGSGGGSGSSSDGGDSGSDGGSDGGSDTSGGSGTGNPGNDKDVGKAGENPNGKGGWGTGSNGKSN